MMPDYIREYSAGDLLSTSLSIYKKHFFVFLLLFILPTIPAMALSIFIKHIDPTDIVPFLISTLIQLIIGILIAPPITVAVSDICLGNQPSLRRSYQRLFDVIGKLAGASLLLSLIIIVGLILLYIPGLIASVMLIFTMTVVVLERLGPVAAIRRSVRLGKGFYWRNFGTLMLIVLFLFIPVFVISFVAGFLIGYTHSDRQMLSLIEYFAVIVSAVWGPWFYIGIVLLYYDMRVRKENYDATALAQSFMG